MKDLKPKSRTKNAASVDWDEVKLRLQRARVAFDEALAPPPDEKRRILHHRARELAQDTQEESIVGETVEVVELLLAGEKYGVESGYVREVYALKEITELPGMPPFVRGITNVRGRIIAVNDLRRFFGLPETETTPGGKLVILSHDVMEFGLLADDITGVRSLPLMELQPPLALLAGGSVEFLRGVTADRMVLLDAEKILSDERMVVHEEAEE